MLKRKEQNKVLYVYMHVIMKIMCPQVIATIPLWQLMHLLRIAGTNEPKTAEQVKQVA